MNLSAGLLSLAGSSSADLFDTSNGYSFLGTTVFNLSGGTFSVPGTIYTGYAIGTQPNPSHLDFNFTGGVLTAGTIDSSMGPITQSATSGPSLLNVAANNTVVGTDYTAASTANTATISVGGGYSLTMTNSAALTIGNGGALVVNGTLAGSSGSSLTLTSSGTGLQIGSGGLVSIPTVNLVGSGGSDTVAFTGAAGGGTISSSSVVLGNSGEVFNVSRGTAAHDLTISGAIGDGDSGYGFTKTGAGVLYLTGTNTYGGATNVDNGSLVVATTASLPGYSSAGSVSVAAGATLGVSVGTAGWESGDIGALASAASFASGSFLGLDTTVAGTYTQSTPIGGSLNLNKLGSGLLALAGNNTYSGSTLVTSGTLQIGNGTSGEGLASQAVVVGNNAAFGFNVGDTLTYAGSIGGNGALTMSGSGKVILSGGNSYSGGTNVNTGTLQIQTANALPGGTLGGYTVASGAMVSLNVGGPGEFTPTSLNTALTGAAFSSAANLGLDTSDASAPFAYSSNIGSNIGGLAKLGSGTLALTGTNTYAGATTISGGVLSFAASALSLSNTTNNKIIFTGSSGTLQWASGNTQDISANLTALTAGQTATLDTNGNNVTLGSNASFTGGATGTLVKAGQGTLTVATKYWDSNIPIFLVNTAASGSNYSFAGGAMAANLQVTAGTVQIPGSGSFLWIGPVQNESSGTVGVSAGGEINSAAVTMGYGVYTNTAACNSVLNISGGTVLTTRNVTYALDICGGGPNQTNTVNLSAGLLSITNSGGALLFDQSNGNSNSGTTVFNLSGGTFSVPNGAIYTGYPLGGATTFPNNVNFNFTGGVLTAGTIDSSMPAIAQSATSGASLLDVSGNNTLVGVNYTAASTTNTATVNVAAGYSLTMSNSTTLTIGNGGVLTVAGGTAAGDSGAGLVLSNSTGGLSVGDGGLVSLPITLASSTSANVIVANGSVSGGTITGAIGQFGPGYSLTTSGGGLLALAGNNTYSGSTLVGGGTLEIGKGTSGEGLASQAVVLSNSAVFGFNLRDTLSYAGSISGNGAVTKSGTGTVILSGANSYSGGTTLNAGTLQMGAALALGSTSGNLAVNGGLLDLNGNSLTAAALSGAGTVDNTAASSSPTLTVGVNNATSTFSGVIQNDSGQVSLTKTGAGTLTLTGASAYSGTTTVSGGTLTVSHALGHTSSLAVASGATFDAEANNAIATVSAPWYVNGTVYSGAGLNQEISNAITLGGGTLSGNAAGYPLWGNYQFDAGLSIVSSGNSLINAPAGVGLEGSSAVAINVVNPGDVLTISSSIFGGGPAPGWTCGIAKSGSGLLILTASNTYSGTTTVSGGTLQLGDGVANNGSVASAITDNAVLTFANPNAQTYTGVIGGSGALIKAGTGALTLTNAANTYSGPTTVSRGTLTVSGQLKNTPSVTVSSGATFDAERNDAADLNGAGATITVNNGTYYSGAGFNQTLDNITLGGGTISGNVSGDPHWGNYRDSRGDDDHQHGQLADQRGGRREPGGANAAVAVNVVNPSDVLTISANMFNYGAYNPGIAKTGSGLLLLTGNNTYTGSTAVNGGTLTIGGAGVLGGGAYAAAISVSGGAALIVNTSNNQTFSGVISGAGGLTQAGPGNLTLTNATNTYSGPTTVSGGTLTVSGQLGNTSSIAVSSGATFDAEASNAIANASAPWYVNGTVYSGSGVNQEISNGITLGGGTLSGNATGYASGYNAWGNYAIAGGQSITSSGNSLISAAGGVALYNVSGNSPLLVNVVNPGDVLTISANVFDHGSYTTGITTTGSGTLILSGNNTYSGSTNVNGGALSVTGSLNGSGAVNVNGGGLLMGSGSVGNVTVISAGTLAPGYTAGAGTLNVANLTLQSGSVLNYTLGAPSGSNGYVNVSGYLNLPASGVTLNLANGGSLTPGTYAMFQYGGSLTGATSGVFTAGNVPSALSGDSFSFSESSGNVIDLVISAAARPTGCGRPTAAGRGARRATGAAACPAAAKTRPSSARP